MRRPSLRESRSTLVGLHTKPTNHSAQADVLRTELACWRVRGSGVPNEGTREYPKDWGDRACLRPHGKADQRPQVRRRSAARLHARAHACVFAWACVCMRVCVCVCVCAWGCVRRVRRRVSAPERFVRPMRRSARARRSPATPTGSSAVHETHEQQTKQPYNCLGESILIDKKQP